MRHERLRTAPFQTDFSHGIATHSIPKNPRNSYIKLQHCTRNTHIPPSTLNIRHNPIIVRYKKLRNSHPHLPN
jgi:hypothetical protein